MAPSSPPFRTVPMEPVGCRRNASMMGRDHPRLRPIAHAPSTVDMTTTTTTPSTDDGSNRFKQQRGKTSWLVVGAMALYTCSAMFHITKTAMPTRTTTTTSRKPEKTPNHSPSAVADTRDSGLLVPPRVWKARSMQNWKHIATTSGGSIKAHNGTKFISTGVYQFISTSPVCATAEPVDHDRPISSSSSCRIYFPDEIPAELSVSAKNRKTSITATPTMCLATAKGNKGRGNNEGTNIPNQDASVVIHGPLQSSQRRNGDEDDDTNVNRYRFVLAALFDGHGEWGHVASQIAVNDFPTRVLQKLREIKTPNPTTATRLIKNALLETDQIAMANMPHQAGSTAVVVFYLNHFVYISSLGDSTALLVQRVSSKSTSSPNHSRRHHNASSIRKPTPNFESSFLSWVLSVFWWYQLSPPMDIAKEESRTTMREPCEYKVIASAVRHKPGDPKERSRIERNGGTVYIPTNNKESSRVVFTLNDESTDSAMQMALAMSRSLGDEDAKELKLVTADASTVVVDLRDYYRTGEPNHFFVILASDGVMDEVETKTVVDTIGTALYAYETNNDDDDRRARRLYDACQDIVKQAVRGWSRSTGNRYRDDISLVVQKIEA